MAKSLNKWTGIGNLGQDPEIRYTGNGSAVVNCTLATSDQWTGKDGQRQEETTWHRLVIWGKLGEIVSEYCSKGSKLWVEGAIKHREYTDNEGVTKHVSEINVKDLIMLGSKGESRSTGHTGADRQPSNHTGTPKPAPDGNTSDSGFDDIPF